MKKFFSFLMVAILAVSVSAATTTFTFSSVDSQTQDGFTVSLDKGSGTAAPNYQSNWPAPRLYANNTITISGKSITSLSIKFAKGNNKKDYASASVNVGEYVSGGEATSTDDYKTDTWTGEAASVIITLGATGQRSIIELTVTGEGKEGGTTDPADDGNITNLNLCDAYYYTEGDMLSTTSTSTKISQATTILFSPKCMSSLRPKRRQPSMVPTIFSMPAIGNLPKIPLKPMNMSRLAPSLFKTPMMKVNTTSKAPL